MKFRKVAMVFGAALLSVGLLSACGGGDDNAEDPATENGADDGGEDTTDEPEVVSTASVNSDPAVITTALSADGNWIVAITADVTVAEDITVEGEFHDKGAESGDLYRKFALYSQDADRNVTDEFTFTVPTMTVKSPNFTIVHGTVKGDVVVEAEGFTLEESTIDGNLTFASEDLKNAATVSDDQVTGEITVAE